MSSTPNPLLLLRLRRHGIVAPLLTWQQAQVAHLGLPLACALLTAESGGGRNVWGHDPTIFVGGYDAAHGVHYGPTVTETAYTAYRRQRGAHGRGGMQGVGPCQLTYYSTQDQADELGGCWIPRHNIAVGFHHLAGNVRQHGLYAGVAAYNGSGPAAAEYARRVVALAEHFKAAGCGTFIGVW